MRETKMGRSRSAPFFCGEGDKKAAKLGRPRAEMVVHTSADLIGLTGRLPGSFQAAAVLVFPPAATGAGVITPNLGISWWRSLHAGIACRCFLLPEPAQVEAPKGQTDRQDGQGRSPPGMHESNPVGS